MDIERFAWAMKFADNCYIFDSCYGRQIGKVLVNGQDVSLVQVERGMAWFYRQYQREQSPNDRRLYDAAEDAANAEKRGLWRDADPVPPWDFRHSRGRR